MSHHYPSSNKPCGATDNNESTWLFSSIEAAQTRSRNNDNMKRSSISLEWCKKILLGLIHLVVLGTTIYLIASWLTSFFLQQEQQQQPAPPYHDSSIHQFQHGTATCHRHHPFEKLKKSSTIDGLNNAAVATDHSLCSKVGTRILRDEGGNAVDAAVAVAFCLGVANPASSGIGGGAFILIHSDYQHFKIRQLNNTKNHTIMPPSFIDARTDNKDMIVESYVSTTNNDNGKLKKQTKQRILEVIDCREVAPLAASADMYLNNNDTKASENGGLAVAVPGELRGLELAHARHGKLSWSQVIQPAIHLAKNGFRVQDHLGIDFIEHSEYAWNHSSAFRKIMSIDNQGHKLLKRGHVLKNVALANTLQDIVRLGSDAIYTGEGAKDIVSAVQNAGGILTEEDLKQYRAILRTPLVAKNIHGGFHLVGVPPPSSGGATVIGAARLLSQILRTRNAPPLASNLADTLTQHRVVEVLRHVFAVRMSMGDPAFDHNYNMTIEKAVYDLVESTDFIEEIQALILDNQTQPLSMYGGHKWAKLHDVDGTKRAVDAHEGDRVRHRRRKLNENQRRLYRKFGYLEDHGTSHLSVVDKEGNAVSMTTTVNSYFGSGVVAPKTGILLNNEMDDFGTRGTTNYFGLEPNEANFIQPGKKPLSSMSPTMAFFGGMQDNNSDQQQHHLGDLFMILGASGGPKIISSVLNTFINHAWLGMSLSDAILHPRIHNQLLYHDSAVTAVEKCPLKARDGSVATTIQVSNRTRRALEKRGHRLVDIDYAGTVQAIGIDILETGTLYAVSDVRKGGSPDGY